MLRSLVIRIGKVWMTVGITTFSVLASVLVTMLVFELTGSSLKVIGLVASTIAPLAIAPPISWILLKLLFRIDSMENEMRELAIRDPLTSLFNRRHFYEFVAQFYNVSDRVGRSYAVIFIDIDHFKRINDTYGHEVGDQVIQAVAAQLQQGLRHSDIVTRFGGEEFAMGLLITANDDAVIVAEKIRQRISAAPMVCGEHRIPVTASLGVAACSAGEHLDIDSLIRKADTALYRAKQSGRNRVCTEVGDFAMA